MPFLFNTPSPGAQDPAGTSTPVSTGTQGVHPVVASLLRLANNAQQLQQGMARPAAPGMPAAPAAPRPATPGPFAGVLKKKKPAVQSSLPSIGESGSMGNPDSPWNYGAFGDPES
jgi:hypothetical protein